MLVGVLQGYVSSRRRRQRRIAELVALVEELDQQATRVREEWLRLQPESELLSECTARAPRMTPAAPTCCLRGVTCFVGRVNADLTAAMHDLQRRISALDEERSGLLRYLQNLQAAQQVQQQAVPSPSSSGQLSSFPGASRSPSPFAAPPALQGQVSRALCPARKAACWIVQRQGDELLACRRHPSCFNLQRPCHCLVGSYLACRVQCSRRKLNG